jgi:DNA-binding MarR family transcriptional regulator
MNLKEPAQALTIDRLSSLIDSISTVLPVIIRKVLNSSMVKTKVGSSEMQMLVMEGLGAGELTASDISRIYCISKSNVTTLVDRLVEHGYAERSHDDKDRRIIKISVTDKGRKLIDKRRRLMKKYVLSALEKLRPDEIDEIYNSLLTYRKTLSKLESIL